MRTIYDFKDLRKLEEATISAELETGVIVTATAAMAIAMRDYYPKYTVVDVHDVVSALLPEWEEVTKDLRNYLALRNSIENYISDQEGNRDLFLSIRRNAADIWNAILLLVEADVYPQDIPDDMPIPVRHFKDIWKRLEIENSSLMNLRTQFAYRLKDAEYVYNSLSAQISLYTREKVDLLDKKLFLLGFYYITPIQARIIDILEHSGIEISYLNCRDIRYKEAGEIWEKTFFEEYSSGCFSDIQPHIKFDNLFGNILNGSQGISGIELAKYASELEFAQAIKEPLQKGHEVYTPDPKSCEKILKEYYPESFRRRHLLAFPVGQYIYDLHMMWNELHNQLELKYDQVYRCFATGWVTSGDKNGRDYLFDLSRLEVFFRDCLTFNEWKERFSTLKAAKKCTSIFDVQDMHNQRWHEMLGNPFRSISAYNVNDDTLAIIEMLLMKLMADAEYLFSAPEKTSINEHFSKITKIITAHMNRDDVLDDEIAIANELLDDLHNAESQDLECPLGAVKDAIMLLIGGHFDESDSQNQETALIDDSIGPLSRIEASLLTNYGQDIHLVLADEFTLPGTPRSLPWPLSDKLLDSLQIKNREDTIRYVSCMRSILENRPLSYRYLFFSFISNINTENHPKLHIEWIKEKGDKEVNASPYVLLMYPDANKLIDTTTLIDFEKEIDRKYIEHPMIEISKPDFTVPIEVNMDYALCDYRYLYSYVVNYLPEYKSEFHYSFILSSMIRAFVNVTGKGKKEITRELFGLFPSFRNVERHQAADYAGNKEGKSEQSYLYDDAEYPQDRLGIHFLRTRELAAKMYDLMEQTHERPAIEEKDRVERCKYCPYTDSCLFNYGIEERDDR